MNVSKEELSTGPCGIEPFDKSWGVGISGMVDNPSPFPRINRILAATQMTTNGELFADRAVLVTEAYKEHAGAIQIVKCAEGVSHVLRNIPIRIYPDELVVGMVGVEKKGASVFPEFGLNWIVDEM